jgi:hypothetical protein
MLAKADVVTYLRNLSNGNESKYNEFVEFIDNFKNYKSKIINLYGSGSNGISTMLKLLLRGKREIFRPIDYDCSIKNDFSRDVKWMIFDCNTKPIYEQLMRLKAIVTGDYPFITEEKLYLIYQ